jgi:hypothetical protein
MAGGDDPAAQSPAPPPTDSSAGPSPAETGPLGRRLVSLGQALTTLRRTPASDLIDLILRRPGRLYTLFFLLIVAFKWPFATIPPLLASGPRAMP